MKEIWFALAIAILPLAVNSQDLNLFEKKTFSRNGNLLLYRILYPKGYNKSKPYPVLTFLHGSGERGNDNEAQLRHGGALFINDSVRNTFPAIVIFPQCPTDSAWNYIKIQKDTASQTGRSIDLSFSPTPTTPALLVKLLLDSLVSSKKADPDRMYIGGLSLGGFGTFDMIERYPTFFRAAIAICGGGDLNVANRFAKYVSVWLFHGDADKSVDVNNSRLYYAELKKLGADTRYNEYPGVAHNSWDNAFQEPQLLPWIFSKSKKKLSGKN